MEAVGCSYLLDVRGPLTAKPKALSLPPLKRRKNGKNSSQFMSLRTLYQ